MTAPYVFQRGEDITLVVEAVGADDLSFVSSLTAVLKEATRTGGVPPAAAVKVDDFTVTPRAASGGVGPGWTLTIPAVRSISLVAGKTYVTNPVCHFVGGGTQIEEPIFFRVEESTA